MRHAQRDQASDFDNPDISDLGREQAENTAHWLMTQLSPQVVLICSPKRRTFQTIEIVSSILGLSFQVHPDLDERKTEESSPAFLRRIESFFYDWSLRPPMEALFVSHHDWLEGFEEVFQPHQPHRPWNVALGHVYEVSFPQFKWTHSIEVKS